MSPLVEEVAKFFSEELVIEPVPEMRLYAKMLLSLIESHPETMARRKQDFNAGREFAEYEIEPGDFKWNNADDYLKVETEILNYLKSEKEQPK